MKTFFFLIASLLTLASMAQQNGNLRLYAYYQPVTPGIQKARDIDENGNRVSANETGSTGNYMIYAVPASAARVYPVELWIKGQKYGVSAKTITQTPVTHTNPANPAHPAPVVLVPKTSSKVLQLRPTDAIPGKHFAAAERLAQNNEVVFVYKQAGKFYYQPLAKFSELGAAAMQ